jgi:hypothetical protein
VVFKLRKTTAGGVRSHGDADSPFIDGVRLVLLEKRRGNEWLEDKPTAEVYAGRICGVSEEYTNTTGEGPAYP